MTLRELAALTRTPERQIRYLIAEGFVPPPRGGRTYAEYGDDHVGAIRRYVALRERGLPPQAIKVLLANGDMVSFAVGPGVALHISPELIGSDVDVDDLSTRIRSVLDDLFKELPHARSHPAARKRPR